jgi:hypothetical protein
MNSRVKISINFCGIALRETLFGTLKRFVSPAACILLPVHANVREPALFLSLTFPRTRLDE